MDLFITGISGLLGLNLAQQAQGHSSVSGCYLSHPVDIKGVQAFPLDLTDYSKAKEALTSINPDLIVHTVGLTDVDRCESDRPLAQALNVETTRNVAKIAFSMGCRLVHISTDQLFDGASRWYTEGDIPNPINNYGSTKWEAEIAAMEACPEALVIRTNFYGWGSPIRTSFSDWICRSLDDQKELTMFHDVFFTPILVNDLADVIFDLAATEASGIFNVSGGERISKYDFALRLADTLGYSSSRIRPISVDEFSFKARRPKEMSLECAKAETHLGISMPNTQDSLTHLRDLRLDGWPIALQSAMVGEG